MKPRSYLIRRHALLDWLTGPGVGFTAYDVRKWVRDGIIPAHPAPGVKKKTPRARAYYCVATVATILSIENPLSPNHTNHTTPC